MNNVNLHCGVSVKKKSASKHLGRVSSSQKAPPGPAPQNLKGRQHQTRDRPRCSNLPPPRIAHAQSAPRAAAQPHPSETPGSLKPRSVETLTRRRQTRRRSGALVRSPLGFFSWSREAGLLGAVGPGRC